MDRGLWRNVLILASLWLPHASALTNTTPPIGVNHQSSFGIIGPLVQNGVYLREDWSRVAIIFQIDARVEEETTIDEGETWFAEIRQDGVPFFGVTVRYFSGCVRYQFLGSAIWHILECVNQTDPDASNYRSIYRRELVASKFARCFLEDAEYAARFAHNDGQTPLGTFAPTPQVAGRIDVREDANKSFISPRLDEPLSSRELLDGSVLPVIEPESANFTVRVTDRFNCKHPIKGTTVTVNAGIRLLPLDGHLHFEDGERGTGLMIPAPSTVATISEDGTSIEGVTDDNGELRFEYRAGMYGVNERITARTFSPYYGMEIEDSRALLTTANRNLFRIDTSVGILVRGRFTSICGDTGHNTGVGENPDDRLSAWVTSATRTSIRFLDEDFYDITNFHLCINDASLRDGGFFDNISIEQKGNDDPPPDRDGVCHFGHRRGLEIDLNSNCVGEDLHNKRTRCGEENGALMPYVDCLTILAAQLDAVKQKERDPRKIHYRWRR